jgi:rubrerythrin
MKNESAVEILKAFTIAKEVELLGLDVYLDFASQTHDTTGKNMFLQLAKDEMMHYRILDEAYKKQDNDASLSDIVIKDSIIQRIVPTLETRDSRVKGKKGLDQENALEAALTQERKAFELFRGYFEKSKAPDTRVIFQKLMDMEQAHYDLIQAELDSIRETGFWFSIPEFDLED